MRENDSERRRDELRRVTERTDPVEGFEVERPMPGQLDDDDGYVPGDHGAHLEQQPSEADVLAAEAELDRGRARDEPAPAE